MNIAPEESSPRSLDVQWLKPVLDPEMGLSLVDLGLVYSVSAADDHAAKVVMTLTSPACPAGDEIISKVKNRMMEFPNIETVDVEIVWEPKWDPASMASEEVKEILGVW